jgi:protein O-GlcNAc transferase
MNEGPKQGGILGRLSRVLGPRAPQANTLLVESVAEPVGASPLINEGMLRLKQSGVAAALPLFEQAAKLEPHSHVPLLMLGNAFSELNELDRAAGYYELARDLAPKNEVIRYNLGLNHLWRGYTQDAINELSTACTLNPSYVSAQLGYIFALHNTDQVASEEIVSAIREWGIRFASEHPQGARLPEPSSDLPRKLRVGFVSGDFRTHSVAHFFEPIASARNRDAFQYVFYSNSRQQDAVTDRLRAYADTWHDVSQLADDELLALIRADHIDILVDLSGQTDLHRLAVFARRAAAVQITYLGFPNSTGLTTMDYRITDAATDPYPLADGWHSETLLRLPDSQWCFRPFGTPLPPGPLPARDAGFITFGSFNNLTKASDTLIRCWRQILRRLPNSRLRLTRVRSSQRAREIVASFEKVGIAANRIECLPYKSEVPYGAQYAGVDIALDHYPYNGVTTTCESLYVGVPVVSLHGRNCVSRSGLSILTALGLPELVASTPEKYVEIALDLANDLPRLERLRFELRFRFDKSPLRAEKVFAAHFEELLRFAWQERVS